MVKNHCLAQSISDCSWGTFVSMLEYKSEWHGKNILRIGRFDPSSKMCNNCGYIKKDMTLDVREWECQKCHALHDRDINAAKNIKSYGLHYKNVGAERSKLKLLENISIESSVKEESPSLRKA